jgi:MYXO-CTERM domain-containing protein
MKRVAWALLLLSLPAWAYKRSVNGAGVCTWWATRGHSFQIDSQGTPDVLPETDVFDAIRRSFQTWSQVTCSDLTFPEEPLSTNPASRGVGYFNPGPNHNLVLFRTRACSAVVPVGDACRSQGGCSNLYDCWDDSQGSSVIASTLVTSNRQSGQILDADIEVNNAPRGSAPAFKFAVIDTCTGSQADCGIDVQNTVTHEAGHTVGLDHSTDPSATMYASGPPGETSKRDLAQDDIDGICSIYPKGAATAVCGSAADSGGCGCSAAQTGPGAALGTLLLLLQIRRRSRRRPQLPINASTDPAMAARCQRGSEN